MRVTGRSFIARYGVAILSVAIAAVVRWFLQSQFGDRAPFTTFYIAVMVAAFYGGLGPGLLATVLSTLMGSYFWLLPAGSVHPSRSANWLALVMFVPTLVVITVLTEALHKARRRAAADARRVIEQEQRYRTIVENASEGIWIIDAEARTTFVNPCLCEMFGYPADEMFGRTPFEFIFDEDQQAARERLRQRQAGDTQPREFRYRRKDGSELWATISTSTLNGPQGEAIGMLALLADVSERKQMEAEREQVMAREQEARRVAEAANQTKDEFLATLSHELRTPLNSIIGWSGMLREKKLPEHATGQAVEAIHRNAKAQAQIIEDLLDVSRIISGKLTLNRQPVALEEVIDAALDAARPVAEAKHVALAKSGQMLDVVMGDSTRLQQVMMNLLTNAVKFTQSGGRVGVRVESDERTARIVVEDNGHGISADFLPYVFERFWQADSSYTRRHSGLGLGLAIVRHLVELHGGTVSAASEGIGQGSTFTVTLPLALVQKTIDSAATLAVSESGLPDSTSRLPLKGVKVLIVDDDEDTREMLMALLSLHGAETLTAGSAADALHRLRGWRPDLLVSDLGMPDEDGYALIRKVRSLPSEEGGNTPAVALTGYASEEESDRVRAAGFQAHAAKPVEVAKLVETIARLAEVGGKGRGA